MNKKQNKIFDVFKNKQGWENARNKENFKLESYIFPFLKKEIKIDKNKVRGYFYFTDSFLDELLERGIIEKEYFNMLKDMNEKSIRNIYTITSFKKYEDLQGSRSITVEKNVDNIKKLANDVANNQMEMRDIDNFRINELSEAIKTLNNEKNHNINLQNYNINKISEIGFKTPKILKYYLDNGVKKVNGIDMIDISVQIANNLGYDTYVADLNDHENCDLSIIKDSDLVISYHVLEHVSRPDLALKLIYNNMKNNSLLHIEIPVEMMFMPNLNVGHMFTFWPQDMYKLLVHAGFKIVFMTTDTPVKGYYIERYLCQKN